MVIRFESVIAEHFIEDEEGIVVVFFTIYFGEGGAGGVLLKLGSRPCLLDVELELTDDY